MSDTRRRPDHLRLVPPPTNGAAVRERAVLRELVEVKSNLLGFGILRETSRHLTRADFVRALREIAAEMEKAAAQIEQAG